jgi:hypothetical protein
MKRIAAGGWLLALGMLAAQTGSDPAALSTPEKEAFLKKTKIARTHGAKLGITGTTRATLSDGNLTHDCSIQTIDEYKPRFEGTRGTEFNFKDTYQFNLAAYKLDRLLGLNMVPVTAERPYEGKKGSWTWWVDNTVMTEKDRVEKKLEPPNMDEWNEQMYLVRVFDQLIFNTDRNLGNLVIDKDWQMWMIDHTRAFRTNPDIREPKDLTKCDRELLEKMKGLDAPTLQRELGKYLTKGEIQAMLKRRDKIVAIFEAKGPEALYTTKRRPG